jgi:hypothetical protein
VKNLKPSLKLPPKYSEDNKFGTKLSAVDTNFDFKEEPGWGLSPTLKKLQAQGLKVESMDPETVMMMAMVDQLTTSMANLTTQVEGITSAPKPMMEEPKLRKPKVETIRWKHTLNRSPSITTEWVTDWMGLSESTHLEETLDRWW